MICTARHRCKSLHNSLLHGGLCQETLSVPRVVAGPVVGRRSLALEWYLLHLPTLAKSLPGSPAPMPHPLHLRAPTHLKATLSAPMPQQLHALPALTAALPGPMPNALVEPPVDVRCFALNAVDSAGSPRGSRLPSGCLRLPPGPSGLPPEHCQWLATTAMLCGHWCNLCLGNGGCVASCKRAAATLTAGYDLVKIFCPICIVFFIRLIMRKQRLDLSKRWNSLPSRCLLASLSSNAHWKICCPRWRP